MTTKSYIEAKQKFLSGDYTSVESFFRENNHAVEYGYCKLLEGDLETAKNLFKSSSYYDFRANWASKLVQFIDGNVQTLPTYFQVRNFLEIDLNLLIKAGQAQFVENIINASDIFFSVNQESYKFIARVMLSNNFDSIALHYLKKAKENFYYDPEMLYMLANCFLKKGEYKLALQYIESCLEVLPTYIPALKAKEKLTKLI